jgi:serine/threonine-protein kinase RsbW
MAPCTRELRAPAEPASLDAIQDVVQELWSLVSDVSPADRVRFETTMVEIVGNIIEHATPADGKLGVMLAFVATVDSGSLTGTVSDDGRRAAVDLGTVAMPGVDAEDGRGLALVLAMSESVHYERSGGTNRWTIVCTRTPAQP